MHAGFSFSYSSISVLLRQPLSIKRAMQERYNGLPPPFRPFLIPLNSYLSLHSSSLITKEIFFPSSHFPYPSTMNSLHSSFSHDLSPPSIFPHFSVLIPFPSSLSLFALLLSLSLHLNTLISLLFSLSPYPFLLSFPSSLTHLRSSL